LERGRIDFRKKSRPIKESARNRLHLSVCVPGVMAVPIGSVKLPSATGGLSAHVMAESIAERLETAVRLRTSGTGREAASATRHNFSPVL